MHEIFKNEKQSKLGEVSIINDCVSSFIIFEFYGNLDKLQLYLEKVIFISSKGQSSDLTISSC